MDESQDAERPPKNVPKYLPRTWKAQPEPEPDAPVKKKKKTTGEGGDLSARAGEGSKKAGKRPKGRQGKDDDGLGTSKGALVEETPTLDTYQARQTARIISGVAIAGIGLLFVFVIYWMVSGTKDEEAAKDEALLAQMPSQEPAQAEREARFMFNRAREVVKRGNVKLTVAFLEKINRSYPRTVAAQEAAMALSRPTNELADFLEKSSGVPTGPSPPKVVNGPAPPPATS
ncbi:MAG: hypothetical protein P4L84_25690, partial [Isosphaeraceae bacterium]|nr:hypothetical protein [Isosphaeraceae bacterium]